MNAEDAAAWCRNMRAETPEYAQVQAYARQLRADGPITPARALACAEAHYGATGGRYESLDQWEAVGALAAELMAAPY